MSPRTSRAQSSEPRFMAPTVSSTARTRRATSAGPSTPTTSSPANSRAGSIQATSPIQGYPKPVQPTAKATSKPQALSSRIGLKLREATSSSNPTLRRSSQKGLNEATAAPVFEGSHKLRRTRYGDAHGAREDQMSAEMLTVAQTKGLVDDETAKHWGTSWHTKGQIELNWSEQVIAKYNAENGIVSESVMGLKEAEAIKKKKDQDLEEWCRAYMLGVIDENGNPTDSEAKVPVVKSKSRERDARRKAVKMHAEKKDLLDEVKEGRVTKKRGGKKDSDLPTGAKTSALTPSLDTQSVSKKTTVTAPKKTSPQTTKEPDEGPIAHLPGLPSYAEYNYYQLTALCGERNIKSGKGTQAVRNRLIRDDTAFLSGQPRDAKNYAAHAREKKTEVPVVPNMPNVPPAVYQRPAAKKKATKRTREDGDDNDDQPKPKGKKVKTT